MFRFRTRIADYKFYTYLHDTAGLSLKFLIKYQGKLCISVGKLSKTNCYTLSVLPLIGATRYQLQTNNNILILSELN